MIKRLLTCPFYKKKITAFSTFNFILSKYSAKLYIVVQRNEQTIEFNARLFSRQLFNLEYLFTQLRNIKN